MATLKSSLISVTAGSVILAAVWQFAERQSEPEAEALPTELRDEPDLYLENATINQFHLSGALKYRLAAEVITHFDEEALTRLQNPTLVLHSVEGAAWEVTAQRGYIRDQPTPSGGHEEVVCLRKNVQLKRRTRQPQLLIMKTSALYLYPDREFAETSEDVSIDTHTGRTKAASMSCNLVSGVVTLDSDIQQRVKTIVLPDQFR